MQIVFPDEYPYQIRRQEKLTFLFSMLGIEANQPERVQKFPLIVAQPHEQLQYFGKMILFFDTRSRPQAIAREVYGQHIVSAQGANSAARVVDQVNWLNANQEGLGEPNERFSAVILFSPHTGTLRIALSTKPYRNISFVTLPSGDGVYSLISVENYLQRLSNEHDDRISAIAEIRERFGDNIEGLPA